MKIRPEIEDVIRDSLNGEALKNGLDFIAYLKKNKMSPQWSAANSWKVSYKTQNVLFIRLGSNSRYHGVGAGSWCIKAFIGEYEAPLSDDFKEIVWANIKYCDKCIHCRGKRMLIFGREIDNVCDSIIIENPNAKAIECIKKIIPMRKNAIEKGQIKRYIYIPKKDRK